MLEINAGSSIERDVQNAAGKACRTIGQLARVHLKHDGRTVRAAEGDCVRLLREFDFRFFNIWIGSAHVCSVSYANENNRESFTLYQVAADSRKVVAC